MKFIVMLLLAVSVSFAGWFSTEYWVVGSESINSAVVVFMMTESKEEALALAQNLKRSQRYGSVSVGIGPCRLVGGIEGVYVCQEVIFRYVNW
jgi:hypothetical protein